jgi:hypothetical protein
MDRFDHPSADTLVLKGRIVKSDMTDENGVKVAGQSDYYFSSGSNSYFIKTASGNFKKEDLEKYVLQEINIKVIKKFGSLDTGPNQEPSWKGNRVGEYIIIIEFIK